MGRPLEITITENLGNLIGRWCQNAGFPDNDDRKALAPKYEAALGKMGELVLNHHEEMNDADFVRAMRFIREFTDLEVYRDHPAVERFMRFQYQEPD